VKCPRCGNVELDSYRDVLNCGHGCGHMWVRGHDSALEGANPVEPSEIEVYHLKA
jgi:hypothetical protein